MAVINEGELFLPSRAWPYSLACFVSDSWGQRLILPGESALAARA